MAMSKRAKKRLGIFLVAVLFLTAGAAGLVSVRSSVRAAKADDWFTKGVALVEEEQFESALDPLGRFVSRAAPDDPRMGEALINFAIAQKHVPTENNRHLGSAASLARRAAELAPDAIEPRALQLELYLTMGLVTETLDVVNQILAIAPTHEEALWARVRALASLGRRDEALTAIGELVGQHPGEIEYRRATIELMMSTSTDTEIVLAYGQQIIDDLPESAGAALLYARLLTETGRTAQAVEQFQRARSLPIDDAQTLREFVRILDRMRAQASGLAGSIPPEFISGELTDEVLASAEANPELRDSARAFMVERLWKRSLITEATALADGLVEDVPAADTEALAWAALIRLEADPASLEESPFFVELQRRTTDGAVVWRNALQGRAAMLDNDLSKALRHFTATQSIGLSGATELVTFWSAEINNAMGEYQRAVDLYLGVLSLDPAWERARLGLLNVHLGQNNTRAAFETLSNSAAWLQSPTTLDGFYIVARVIVAAIEEDIDGADVQAAVETAESLTLQAPESGDFAALYARALLSVGRNADAQTEIARLLSGNLPANTAELQTLLDRMLDAGVDGAEQVSARIRERAVDNPEVRFQIAIESARAGRVDEGEQFLRDAIRAQDTDLGRLVSERYLVLYLDRVGSPDALESLIDFAQRFPDVVATQRTLLDSQAAWANEQSVLSAIARLRELTGESGAAWRIYDARRLLTFHANDSTAAEALDTLAPLTRREPAQVGALVLAAEANRLLGDRDAAIDSLSRVMDVAPEHPGVAPQLITMLREAGRNTEAQRRLRDYLQSDNLSLAERRRRAQLLLEQGLWGAALPELEAIASEGSSRDRVFYGVALARQGQIDKAIEVFDLLIGTADVDSEAIIAAADFFASQRDMVRAEAALSMIPSSLGVTHVRLIEAAFRSRHGQQSRANAILEELAQSDPSPQVWLERIRQAKAGGRIDQANGLLTEAISRWPQDEQVQALVSVSQVSNLAGLTTSDLSALASGMSTPEDREAAEKVLAALQQMQADGQTTPASLVMLRRITAEHPTYYTGWRVLVNSLVTTGEPEQMNEAIQAVRAVVDLIPSSPDAAQLAYELFSQTGRLDEAANAARQWRLRTVAAPYAPDLAIATAEAARGRFDDALVVLEPWRDRVIQEADTNVQAMELYAGLLVRTGQVDAAHEFLWERAASDDNWAIVYMRVALALDHNSSNIEAWLERIGEEVVSPPARLMLAQAWINTAGSAESTQNRQLRAIPILEGLATGAQFATEALTLLGLLYESLDQLSDAEQAYRRAIAKTPTFDVALNNLAYLIIKSDGDAEEAVAFARRAVAAMDPDVPAQQRGGYRDTLAACLLAAGQSQEAASTYREALAINPAQLASHVGLAEALLDLEDPEGAMVAILAAQQLLVQSPDAEMSARVGRAAERAEQMSSAQSGE